MLPVNIVTVKLYNLEKMDNHKTLCHNSPINEANIINSQCMPECAYYGPHGPHEAQGAPSSHIMGPMGPGG